MGNLLEALGQGKLAVLVGGAIVATTLVAAACSSVPLPGKGLALTEAGRAAPAPLNAAVATNTEARLVTTEWKFEPGTISVPVGKQVHFTLENKGVIEHDIEIKALNVHLAAKAGQMAQATFTFDKPGTYDFECTLPGHKEAGMKGQLIVVGESGTNTQAAAAANAGAPTASGAAPALEPAKATTRLPLPQVAPPIPARAPTTVRAEVEAKEVTAVMADGVSYNFWTFGGTVPGPMVRVRQGDTVELTFKNAGDSKLTHSIDLHAVTGPGGGARVTQMAPGGQATFKFQALNPGVYVYHCATPMVAHHIANGMYGLIVVEPPQGLPKVDREYYVMQGDFYVKGSRGQKGHQDFSLDKMLDERPDFVVFNGGVGALTGENALKAKVGETVRIFFGVGGPNITSSFHVIGEIFDRVYPEGSSEPLTNVQTTLVPTGGATMVEFTVDVPGTYVLVDHSLGRLEKGGAAMLAVEGPANPTVFDPMTKPGDGATASGH